MSTSTARYAAVPERPRPPQGVPIAGAAGAAAATSAAGTGGAQAAPKPPLYSGRDMVILAALVLGSFAFLMMQDHAGRLAETLTTTVIPCIIAVVAIMWDWDALGPTVALKNCAIAAAIAWFAVVPLHFLTDTLLDLLSGSLLFVVVLAVVVGLVALCGVVGWIAAVLILVPLLFSGDFLAEAIRGPLGHIFLFVAIFWCARLYMRIVVPQHTDPATWPHVTAVDAASEEFATQRDIFLAACTPWEHKYDFDLSVRKLYRFDIPATDADRVPAAVSDRRRLFHGTQWESAMGIACDGFRLPSAAGMFGRGIYFADCPLKCWRYCFASPQMADVLPRMTGRGGYVFMCSVELGKAREEVEAQPALAGYNRGGWRAWLTRQWGAYDSVEGLTEERGGALRVPEYIVYNPKQARLAYLFEVHKEPRRARPGASGAAGTAANNAANIA